MAPSSGVLLDGVASGSLFGWLVRQGASWPGQGNRPASSPPSPSQPSPPSLAYCWTDLNVRVVPLSGGNATVRSGSALSILRKQANSSWVLARDANLLTPAS